MNSRKHNHLTKNFCNIGMIKKFFKMSFLFSVFALSITGCNKVEQKTEEANTEAPRIEYKQLIVENGESVDNAFFANQTPELGPSINYQTRAGNINILDYVLENPELSVYVNIEKAYAFGDKYIIIVSTGEGGRSCPATTYAIGIDSKSEMVTGKEEIDGCSESLETLSEGNKLIVKKEGAASTFINGEVKQPPLNPFKADNQQTAKESLAESKVAILLTSDVEWLPEGTGVLLTTNKGYINGYSQSMMEVLGDGKKGECYTLKSESNKAVTIHKNKYPDLSSLENETEDLIAERITCN